jgi:hypothetical protein
MGASAIGTSHLRAAGICEDSAACMELATPAGATFVAVASDGAGSAQYPQIGSRIVTRGFCRAVRTFVNHGGRAQEIDSETVEAWLDDIRDRIGQAALNRSAGLRDFAATLVGCIVQGEGSAVVHIGDGACVVRIHGEDEWKVVSWPAQGEYASTTYFVTDDPAPRIGLTYVSGEVVELAVFTDGLERLALEFSTQTAFAPFFERMLLPLKTSPAGRQRQLSTSLARYLDSAPVTDRTDDDKTLIMARLA